MYKKKKTYELEVHFGLLVLVVIMLCLNLVSNFVIFNAKNNQKDELSREMSITSMAISRYIQNNKFDLLLTNQKNSLINKYNLDKLFIIPPMKNGLNDSEKLLRLSSYFKKLPQNQINNLSKIILTNDFQIVSRADNNQYYYAISYQKRDKQNILVLSKENSKLAYLEDALQILVFISLTTVFAIAIIYILLYRFIISPFNKLKENATTAGRSIPSGNYQVDSVIEEYQTIIKELKEKESELLELHKKATQRADSFELFNQYLLGSMQAGIITIDKSGNIINLNKSIEKMCNLNSNECIGNNFDTLKFLNKVLIEKINKTLNSEIHHPYEEYEFENPSIAVGLIISPVCDNDTHQIGASVLINDISEIKKLHTELEKNRQMSALGEMSAGLAHQLRNSLGAILGYNQLVKKRLTQNNLETTSIDSMALELRESEDLIKRFLHFTKPFNYTPETEVISSIVEEIIKTLTLRADFQKITFRFEDRFPLHKTISIDQLLFKQALTNIIENSKNAFLDYEGVITIYLFEEDNNCILTIKDNGCGISPENLGKIFTPFYSTNPSGTGLGLPLSQKIIVLHNGILQVDSTLTKGTIFTIQLPLILETKKETSEKKIAVS